MKKNLVNKIVQTIPLFSISYFLNTKAALLFLDSIAYLYRFSKLILSSGKFKNIINCLIVDWVTPYGSNRY